MLSNQRHELAMGAGEGAGAGAGALAGGDSSLALLEDFFLKSGNPFMVDLTSERHEIHKGGGLCQVAGVRKRYVILEANIS